MPHGAKYGGRDFKPGHAGGPGRPKIPPEVKKIRDMLQGEYEAIAMKLWRMNQKQLAEHLKDPSTPVAELWIGQLFVKGVNKGDHTRLESIMNRVCGRPKERLEVSGPDGGPQRYQETSDEDLDAEIERLQGEVRALKEESGGER